MGSDSICSGSSKELGKKKRTNRLAKLKQSKLDVRREQWLSQVKNKECNVDSNGMDGSPPSCMQVSNERNRLLESLEQSRAMEAGSLSIPNRDMVSLMTSTLGPSLDHNFSRKNHPGSCSSSYCSGSFSEEEENDVYLDDWEAIADAFILDDNLESPCLEPTSELEISVVPPCPQSPNKNSELGLLKAESRGIVPGFQPNCQAWRPDDALRPQNLPNLSKQHCFPINSEWHCGHGGSPWVWPSIVSQPSSCPICYEDLDFTDSNFLPCSCGFRLCLFCHKRILEADGRCPGCRKQYDVISGNLGSNGEMTSFQPTRSCCVKTRS